MNFKKNKYNIIFLALVLIIIGAFAFPIFYNITAPNIDPNPGGDVGGDTGNEDKPDPGKPTDPDKPTVPENPTEPEEPSDDEIDPNVEKYLKYSSKLIKYSLDKTFSEENYSASISMRMETKAAGVTVTQNMTGTIQKAGNITYENTLFKATGSMSNMAANYIRAFYFDGTNYEHWQTANNSSDTLDQASVTSYNEKQFLDKFKINFALSPEIDFSNFNIEPVKEVKAQGKDCYKFVINANNVAALDPRNKDYYGSTGQLRSITLTKETYEIYINVNSGYIVQYLKKDNISGFHPDTGFQATATPTITMILKNFAKPNIERPEKN